MTRKAKNCGDGSMVDGEVNEVWGTGSERSMVETSGLESDGFPCTVSGAQTAPDLRLPSLNLLYCINNLFL